MAKKRKKKQSGGPVIGPSHDNGGVPFSNQSTGEQYELEGGEFIINKESTAALGNQFLNKLNSTGTDMNGSVGFQQGQLGNGSNYQNGGRIGNRMVENPKRTTQRRPSKRVSRTGRRSAPNMRMRNRVTPQRKNTPRNLPPRNSIERISFSAKSKNEYITNLASHLNMNRNNIITQMDNEASIMIDNYYKAISNGQSVEGWFDNLFRCGNCGGTGGFCIGGFCCEPKEDNFGGVQTDCTKSMKRNTIFLENGGTTGGGMKNPITQVNLTAERGQFVYKNNRTPYSGPYHIHQNGVYMIGPGKMGVNHEIKSNEIIVRANSRILPSMTADRTRSYQEGDDSEPRASWVFAGTDKIYNGSVLQVGNDSYSTVGGALEGSSKLLEESENTTEWRRRWRRRRHHRKEGRRGH
tara:strand:- start:630 stop:1853 length:1224 start_codon:yes stop_codon:yes gene_type:complete